MTLSNHEKLDVTKRISRINDYRELTDILRGLSLASEIIADEADRARILSAMRIVSGKSDEIYKKNEADHLARTIEALALYDEHDEKLACLKRMGWFLEDATEAGLIEVATPVEADVDLAQEQDAVAADDLEASQSESLEQVAKRANDLPDVKSARIWKGKRVYIDLCAKDHTFRGDRNHQLYFCADRGLVSQHGPGITSSNYDEAVEKFLADFAA